MAAVGLSLVTLVISLSIRYAQVSRAQRETRQALDLLRIEQGKTVEALAQAEANFRQARAAVEEYFTTVGQETLLDEPGMHPLRERLLRSALKYHESFLAQRQDDPSQKAELALSAHRYAEIARLMGRSDEVVPSLHRAIDLCRGLIRDQPDRPEHRAGSPRPWSRSPSSSSAAPAARTNRSGPARRRSTPSRNWSASTPTNRPIATARPGRCITCR